MEQSNLDIPKLFGQNVQKYRKLSGLTQEELSKRLDISQKHLSIIETGTQFASSSLIERICTELNVSPAALFGEDLNQKYFDKLYSLMATHFENKINWVYSCLRDEIESLKNQNNTQNKMQNQNNSFY